MKKPTTNPHTDACLRTKAEREISPSATVGAVPTNEVEALALVHELQVHQIELEMQNDELRRAQSELITLAARYRELYDFAPIGYFTVDDSDRIVEANLAGAALFKIGRRDLVNRTFASLISLESRTVYREFVSQVQLTGDRQTCELIVPRQDGASLHLQAEAVLTDDAPQDVKKLRIVLLDINDRKQLERLAEASAQQFRANFENVFYQGPLGIAFVDLNTRFLHANSQFSRLLGYAPDELVSMHSRDIVHPDDISVVAEVANGQLSGKPASFGREVRYRRKSGETFWSRTLVTLMRDGKGEPIYFMKLIEDITEQKMAEQRRLESIIAERTRIAQDIHDTLAQGFTGILIQLQAAEYAPQQDQARFHIAQASALARESLQEARRSVHALRPQALERDPLPGALARLVGQAGTREDMKVQFAVHGTPFTLPDDSEDHLYRVGQEALTNAIKHSKAADILLDLCFEPTQVRLSIKDNGVGFDTKDGFQGTGFGLVGMSERADRIGGSMALISSPNHGTTVSITISVAAPDGEESIL